MGADVRLRLVTACAYCLGAPAFSADGPGRPKIRCDFCKKRRPDMLAHPGRCARCLSPIPKKGRPGRCRKCRKELGKKGRFPSTKEIP